MDAIIQKADFYRASSLLHPLIIGGIVLIVVFIYIRLTSSRSLSQLSAFSIIANICLGSTVSRIITQPDLHLARGLISILTIIGFEYATDWLTVQHSHFENIFRKHPTLLLFRGEMLERVMRKHRVTKSAVHSSLRLAGLSCPSQAEAVVLEMNGALSVVRLLEDPFIDCAPSLEAVPHYAEMREQSTTSDRSPSASEKCRERGPHKSGSPAHVEDRAKLPAVARGGPGSAELVKVVVDTPRRSRPGR